MTAMYKRVVEYVQYAYDTDIYRCQPAYLAPNGLYETVLIGRTDDQRYGLFVHDGKCYGLTEVTDLDVKIHVTGDMHL